MGLFRALGGSVVENISAPPRLRVSSPYTRGTGPAANRGFVSSCLRGKSSPGFTLIELLTVIFIIAILIAILLPALIGAVHQAYSTSTQAELNSVRAACLSYDAAFNAYPGPFAEADISQQKVLANGLPVTGTQNMLLGLMGTFYLSSASPPYPTTGGAPITITDTGPVGTTTVVVPSIKPFGSGPIDYSNGNLQKNSYLSPAVEDLLTNPPPSPTTISNGLPTLYDAFPDGLPILYYRKVPGMPGTTGAPVWLNSTTSGGAPGTGAAFYLNSNLAYTSPGVAPTYLLAAKNGTSYSEGYSSYNSSTNNPYGSPVNALAATVVNQGLVGTNPPGGFNTVGLPVQGGFVLIGAGPDHIYGQNLNPNVAGSGGVAPPSDDIVVFGGQ